MFTFNTRTVKSRRAEMEIVSNMIHMSDVQRQRAISFIIISDNLKKQKIGLINHINIREADWKTEDT